MRTLLVLVLVLVGGAALAQREPTLPPRAAKRLKAGLEAYRRGDYDRAVAEFKAAWDLAPDRRLLYSWAQAERLRGNCDQAVRLYRKFAEGDATGAQREAARVGVERCAREAERDTPPPASLPAEPERLESDPLPPAKLQPESAPVVGSPAHRPRPDEGDEEGAWYADPVGAALLAVGGLCLGIGVGYQVAAQRSLDATRAAEDVEEFDRALEMANARRRIALIGLTAGGVFTSAAILRYALRARRGAGPSVAVGIDGTTLLVWEGEY